MKLATTTKSADKAKSQEAPLRGITVMLADFAVAAAAIIALG